MELPLETQQHCQQFLEKVRQDPNYHFNPYDRLILYNSFGPSNQFNEAGRSQISRFRNGETSRYSLSEGDKVFGWLAVITARKVLPIYEKTFPRGTTEKKGSPAQMLDVAKNVLLGKEKPLKAYGDLCGKFYDSTTNIDFFLNEQLEFAMYTAYNALLVTLCGMGAGGSRKHFVTDDSQIKPGNEDFAATAMKTFCALDPNLPKGDFWQQGNERKPIGYSLIKRLEFWEWWLTEAIPQAWDLAHKADN